VTEIGEALASVDVSGRDPEWRAEWAELSKRSGALRDDRLGV
jgi:hypothetical protein